MWWSCERDGHWVGQWCCRWHYNYDWLALCFHHLNLCTFNFFEYINNHFCCGKKDFVCLLVSWNKMEHWTILRITKQNKHRARQITVTYPPGHRSCSMLKISLIKMPLALPLDMSADFVTRVDDGKNMILICVVYRYTSSGIESLFNSDNKYFYPKWMLVIRLMWALNWNRSVVGPKWGNIKILRLLSITSWAIHKEHDYFIHNQLQQVV